MSFEATTGEGKDEHTKNDTKAANQQHTKKTEVIKSLKNYIFNI